MTPRRAALLLLALALASCGDVRWVKSGASDADVAQALSACRKESQDRYGVADSPAAGQLDPRFGTTGPSPAETRMQQAEGVGRCMRGKGYDLAPAGK